MRVMSLESESPLIYPEGLERQTSFNRHLVNYFLFHCLVFLFFKMLLLSKTLLVFLPMWGKMIPSVDFYQQH